MFHQRLQQLAAIPSHRRSDTLALQMSGRWEPHHGHPWTSISTEKSSKNPTSRLHETRNCGGKVWKADPSRRLHQDALQLHRWENLLAIFKHPRNNARTCTTWAWTTENTTSSSNVAMENPPFIKPPCIVDYQIPPFIKYHHLSTIYL